MSKQIYSINLYLRELLHFLVFIAVGACPWFRPWNWVAAILYLWGREAYWDPIGDTGKTWWNLKYGEAFYSWGEGKWINYKVKGFLDVIVCLAGALLGTVLYYWLLEGQYAF